MEPAKCYESRKSHDFEANFKGHNMENFEVDSSATTQHSENHFISSVCLDGNCRSLPKFAHDAASSRDSMSPCVGSSEENKKMSNRSSDEESLPSTILKTPVESESSISSESLHDEGKAVTPVESESSISSESLHDEGKAVTLGIEINDFLSFYEEIKWLQNHQKKVSACINYDSFTYFIRRANLDEKQACVEELQAVCTIEDIGEAMHEHHVTKVQLISLLHMICFIEDDDDSVGTDVFGAKEWIMEVLRLLIKESARTIKRMEKIQNFRAEVLELQLQLSGKTEMRSGMLRYLRSLGNKDKENSEKRAIENRNAHHSKKRKITRLEKAFEHHSRMLHTLNQIIAAIITGSTINWSGVHDMKELVVSVSEPIDVQIRDCVGCEAAA